MVVPRVYPRCTLAFGLYEVHVVVNGMEVMTLSVPREVKIMPTNLLTSDGLNRYFHPLRPIADVSCSRSKTEVCDEGKSHMEEDHHHPEARDDPPIGQDHDKIRQATVVCVFNLFVRFVCLFV